ncbi:hypothetical protein [Streptomyces longwoodensis]|uniref:hypothetical protein n=1 Tax=Streptomyces longwoodensis TaxID=68231 RepID=UPI0033D9A775
MGVFDGGTYCVSVYYRGSEDPEDEYTDDPRKLVADLRADPSVRCVQTHAVHYVTGAYQGDLSFGDPYEEED